MEKNLSQRGDRWLEQLLELVRSSGLWPPFTYNQSITKRSLPRFPEYFPKKKEFYFSRTKRESIHDDNHTEPTDPLVYREETTSCRVSLFLLYRSLSKKEGEETSEVNFRAIHAKRTQHSHACKHGARFIRARNELLCIGNKEQWPEMRNKGNV